MEYLRTMDPAIKDLDLSKVRVYWTDEDGVPMVVDGVPVFHVVTNENYGWKIFQGNADRFTGVGHELARLGLTQESEWGVRFRGCYVFARFVYPSGREGVNEASYWVNDQYGGVTPGAPDLSMQTLWAIRKTYSPLKEDNTGSSPPGDIIDSYLGQPNAYTFDESRGRPFTALPSSIDWDGTRSEPPRQTDQIPGDIEKELAVAEQKLKDKKRELRARSEELGAALKRLDQARRRAKDLQDVLSRQ